MQAVGAHRARSARWGRPSHAKDFRAISRSRSHAYPIRIFFSTVPNAHVSNRPGPPRAHYTPLVPTVEPTAEDAGRTAHRRSACPTNELRRSNKKSCFAREPAWRSMKPIFARPAGCCKATPISTSPTTSSRLGSRFKAVVSEFRTSCVRAVGPGGVSLAIANEATGSTGRFVEGPPGAHNRQGASNALACVIACLKYA